MGSQPKLEDWQKSAGRVAAEVLGRSFRSGGIAAVAVRDQGLRAERRRWGLEAPHDPVIGLAVAELPAGCREHAVVQGAVGWSESFAKADLCFPNLACRLPFGA